MLDRDNHELLITELVDPETTPERKYEIATELRSSDIEAHELIANFKSSEEKKDEEIRGLQQANSVLWRQTGQVKDQEEPEPEPEKPVTIDDL